jgi:hypothetical protein
MGSMFNIESTMTAQVATADTAPYMMNGVCFRVWLKELHNWSLKYSLIVTVIEYLNFSDCNKSTKFQSFSCGNPKNESLITVEATHPLDKSIQILSKPPKSQKRSLGLCPYHTSPSPPNQAESLQAYP